MRDFKNKKIIYGLAAVALAAVVFTPQNFALAHTGPVEFLSKIQLVPGPGPLHLCDLWHLSAHIINFLLFVLATPILIIMLLAGGIIWLTSAGNPNQVTRGKKLITSAIIGVLIAFSGWLIIGTIINTLANAGFSAAWNAIECAESGTGTGTETETRFACNSSNQCVASAGGPFTDSNCNGQCAATLTCSATTVSAEISGIITCVRNGAAAAGISVNTPTLNQTTGGCHTCASPNTPAPGCTNSGTGISCHYGGTLCTGTGHAVDFSLATARNAVNWQKLVTLAAGCSNVRTARCEKGSSPYIVPCTDPLVNHVHVNDNGNCGCN
jgi:hypothetical protein